jgi:hypothetical protein
MKYIQLKTSSILIAASVLLAGIFVAIVIHLQESSAQEQANSPSMAKVDSSKTASNITINIGDLIIESKSITTSVRAPETQDPTLEVSYTGNGTLAKVNVNVTDIGTALTILGGEGIRHSKGHGILLTQDGDVVTYTFKAIGQYGSDGKLRNHGSVFFDTVSTGKLAFLKNIVGVFADEIDSKGNSITKIWELK